VTYASTLAITEVAVFDGATGSGTDVMLQRHTFDALNVVSGMTITFTIDTTAAAA